MGAVMREEVRKNKDKIQWGENGHNWRIKGEPSYEKLQKERDGLQGGVSTLERIYNRQTE